MKTKTTTIRCNELAIFKYFMPGRRTGFCCGDHLHGVVINAKRLGYELIKERYYGDDKYCAVVVRISKSFEETKNDNHIAP